MFLRPWLRQTHLLSIESRPTLLGITPNAALPTGGISVTITGTHFRVLSDGTVPTVLFGTTPATSVVVVDAQTITCVVPAHAVGLVDISVSVGTETGTLAEAFTFYAPALVSASPAFGPSPGGTQVVLFGRNFTAGSSVTFGGVAATAVTFLDDQHYLVTTPNHALGFVDIVLTDSGGVMTTLSSGFQYTLLTRGEDIRRMPGVAIHETLGNSPNTANLSIDGESNTPINGERVQVFDDATMIFAGTAVNVKMRYEGQIDQLAFDLQCIDFTYLLNRRCPVGVYEQVSASEIVRDLITKYAPGFTTNFVQTNLVPITIQFDGSQSFSDCLTAIAKAIGGGHWYVDYTQDVHFFHVVPPNIGLPGVPDLSSAGTLNQMSTSLAAAPVVALVAPLTSFSITRNWSQLAYSFLYSNGFESALSEISVPVWNSGPYDLAVSGIGTGPAIGALTCVGVRLYLRVLSTPGLSGAVDDWQSVAEMPNGTASVAGVYVNNLYRPSDPHTRKSSLRNVAKPSAPPGAPSDGTATTRLSTFAPGYFGAGFGTAVFSYGVSAVYPDGTESVISQGSPAITTQGVFAPGVSSAAVGSIAQDTSLRSVHLGSVPSGAVVNGKSPVFRYIYRARNAIWTPDNVSICSIIPDNTTSDLDFVPYGSLPNTRLKGGPVEPVAPVWPWPDGPYLENFTPPDPIDDNNTTLLHEDSGSQPFTVEFDSAQMVNKIFLKGKGTTLTADALAGDGVLHVASVTSPLLHSGGGQLFSSAGILTYDTYDDSSDDPTVSLTEPLTVDLLQGSMVNIYLMVENKAAQEALGKVEFDKDGVATDGIHEATISDDSMDTWVALYMKGYATLEQFSLPIVTVRGATRDAKMRVGSTLHVDQSNPPCHGDFLVQEVDKDQIHDESDQIGARYTFIASSIRFQLEDYLLSLSDQVVTGGIPSLQGVTGVDFSSGSSSGGSSSLPAMGTFRQGRSFAMPPGTGGFATIFNDSSYSITSDTVGAPFVSKFAHGQAWAGSSNQTPGTTSGVMRPSGSTFLSRTDYSSVIRWRVLTPTIAELKYNNADPTVLNSGNAFASWFGLFPGSAPTGSPARQGIFVGLDSSSTYDGLVNPNTPPGGTIFRNLYWWVSVLDVAQVVQTKKALLPVLQDTVYDIEIAGTGLSTARISIGVVGTTPTTFNVSHDFGGKSFAVQGWISAQVNGQLVGIWANEFQWGSN